jgi:HAD superfamily hydrolase (TIGR01484 family)
MNNTLLALDLDGTCLDRSMQTIWRLKTCLHEFSKNIILAYVTGRTYESAIMVIRSANLPIPKYLVSDVGNRVYYNDGGSYLQLDETYEEFNCEMWNRVMQGYYSTKTIPNGVTQDGELRRRLGFWVLTKNDAENAVSFLQANRSAKFAVIRYDGPTTNGLWWIDLLPRCAGKATAVLYISFLEGIPTERVFAIGDSINDADMLLAMGFHSAIPANASQRLKSITQTVMRSPDVTPGDGPDGTAQAIWKFMKDSKNKYEASMENSHSCTSATLESFRGLQVLSVCPEALTVWPDRLRNWGLQPGKLGQSLDKSLVYVNSVLERRRNWWWESADNLEKKLILDRLKAIPTEFLIDRLQKYIRENLRGVKLLGGMVSGSFLYAPSKNTANDLDMVLLLEKLQQPSIGIEIEVPGLRSRFPDHFARRLQFDRVGLGLIDISSLNNVTSSPVVLQIVASLEGSGLPLFGREVTDSPMPIFDLLSQAIKLINDAAFSSCGSNRNYQRRVRMRCEEASRIMALARRNLSNLKQFRSLHISAQDSTRKRGCQSLRGHRKQVTEIFFQILKQVLPTPSVMKELT